MNGTTFLLSERLSDRRKRFARTAFRQDRLFDEWLEARAETSRIAGTDCSNETFGTTSDREWRLAIEIATADIPAPRLIRHKLEVLSFALTENAFSGRRAPATLS